MKSMLNWKVKRNSLGPQSYIGYLGSVPFFYIRFSLSRLSEWELFSPFIKNNSMKLAADSNYEALQKIAKTYLDQWLKDAGLKQQED